MNFDEFEKKLQSQPMREIPGNWRSQILHAAAPTQKAAWWRELLWPCPQAWAGLAAVWLVILALNLVVRDPSSPPSDAPRFASSREQINELKEQQLILARLMSPAQTAEAPPQPALSPRSERRKIQFFI